MKNMGRKRLFGILIFLGVFAASSAVVMLLWNWIVPPLAGWGMLGYWQAAGLLLLCKLLFGGMGKCGPWRGEHPHPMAHLSQREKAEIRERVAGMSRGERREYIRRHMFGGGPGEPQPGDDGHR